MKKPTMKDVAKLANVSVSSVSRYINDPGSINPIPALLIEKAIKELGYIPNTYAQGLRRGNSNTIAVIVPGLGPYYSQVCTALSDFFYQNKYILYICETGGDVDKERYLVNTLISQQVAGFLMALSGTATNYIEETYKKFPNIVMIEQYEKGFPIDMVYEDNHNSSYLLTQSMIKRGHRQFALLSHMKDSPYRLQGTTRALKEAGLDVNNMYLHFDIKSGEDLHERLQESLSRTPRSTAVIGYSPLIVENTMISLNRLNKRIPEEVDLAGYTLNDFQVKFRFEIPCVIQQPYELGIRAGDLLLRKLRRSGHQTAPTQKCISPKLIIPGRA